MGRIRLKTDVVVMEIVGVGLDVVLRDNTDRLVAIGVRKLGARWTAGLAETMVLK